MPTSNQSESRNGALLDAAIEAAQAFAKDLTYLRHPKVRAYLGTANGDSPEKWDRDYVAELCRVILAASLSEKVTPVRWVMMPREYTPSDHGHRIWPDYGPFTLATYCEDGHWYTLTVETVGEPKEERTSRGRA